MKLKYNIPLTYPLFRIAFGILLMINGWSKWITLPYSSSDFPDPLGIGSTFSIYLAILSELICGLAILLGFKTRIVSLPVIVTFTVAVFLVHTNDPFDVKQVAILYLITSIYIMLKGSGNISIDKYIRSLKMAKSKEIKDFHK